ncbi:hypothetical protein Nepgr_006502 [Nepenthes gracilis]|uniref:Uncharacterized protein n=1 Tax=Nepenthes gracilis TaxID=150966 RepID=A0AAD3XHE1_NEPGR|nr:hypothetical protein Nepgr_006502 [Nepenthes gracilis]
MKTTASSFFEYYQKGSCVQSSSLLVSEGLNFSKKSKRQTATMKSARKPPLATSPMRLHAPRTLRSNTTPMRNQSGYLTETRMQNRASDNKGLEIIRPEYTTISCELRALAKMVEEEFGTLGSKNNSGFGNLLTANKNCQFERGRFYVEYSARRNERLRRKKQSEIGTTAEPRTVYNLGVKVETAKRNDSKRLESLRKSVSATYSVDRSEHPRYSLRSIKKPPLPLPMDVEKSAGGRERKARAQRAKRKIGD